MNQISLQISNPFWRSLIGVIRRLVLILCVVAVVLLGRVGMPTLFALAVFIAFANLLSSHLICVLDAYPVADHSRSWRDPVYLALVIHRTAGGIGVALLLLTLSQLR